MQTREFAERVLFSDRLEDKLAPPPGANLDDDDRGPALVTPASPGRPEWLAMATGSGAGAGAVGMPAPGEHEIADDAHRGRLLHFFANHELLATELMALVLLKFPDAPAEFRRGVVRTLRDEQVHTQLYLDRMAACGVGFGDHPVNGFFWNCVAPMESPLDYVTRLSLTFEQANLDFSRHFGEVFARSGDANSAALLQRIYRDEIAHVGYGLRWFRRWKADPAQSDWDAYRHRLVLPLSAARAKGIPPFNREGRSAAGLDDDFIRRLSVFSQSRGRTPNVYWFNPDAEAFAGDPRHRPSAAALDLQRDLAPIAAQLARADDVVLVPEPPSLDFLTSLQNAGLTIPEFVAETDTADLAGRKLNSLRPWAWTPDARELAAPLVDQASSPPPQFDPALFSKAWSAGLLASLLESPGAFDGLLADASSAGATVRATADLPGVRPLVVKAPFSTAGRDRIVLENRGLSPREVSWLERALGRCGSLVAEPWCDRLFDFSVQYERSADGGVRRLGFVHLVNSPRGQFRACRVPPKFTDGLGPGLRRFLHQPGLAPGGRGGWLAPFFRDVVEPRLEAGLAAAGYHGPFGVDSFVYRDPAGDLKLRPVVELNPRFTMGRVAFELARRAPQNSTTTLEITTLPAFRAARGSGSEPGAVALNDPGRARRFVAILRRSQP